MTDFASDLDNLISGHKFPETIVAKYVQAAPNWADLRILDIFNKNGVMQVGHDIDVFFSLQADDNGTPPKELRVYTHLSTDFHQGIFLKMTLSQPNVTWSVYKVENGQENPIQNGGVAGALINLLNVQFSVRNLSSNDFNTTVIVNGVVLGVNDVISNYIPTTGFIGAFWGMQGTVTDYTVNILS